MAFDTCSGNLLVSKPSQNRLFPGFGIVKVTVFDLIIFRYDRATCNYDYTFIALHFRIKYRLARWMCEIPFF